MTGSADREDAERGDEDPRDHDQPPQLEPVDRQPDHARDAGDDDDKLRGEAVEEPREDPVVGVHGEGGTRLWLATFVDDGRGYDGAEAVLIEADGPDEAAEVGLAALLEDFPDTACQCCGPIADHVNVLAWEGVHRYAVQRTAVRQASDAPAG